MISAPASSIPERPLSPSELTSDQIRAMIRMLVIPSLISVAMILGRFAYVADLHFRFLGLIWNLYLAWIPMALALFIWRIPPTQRLRLCGLFTTWLLFFPNAFYLVTDLKHTHKFGTDGVSKWYDILMTGCFAASGLFLGSMSLYLLHSLVRQRFGTRIGWVFASAILALGSFGIYLGRFLRFNSWDVVTKPEVLLGGIVTLLSSKRMEVAIFCGAFFVFSVVVYGFVFSAAHLKEQSPQPVLAE